jgi:hypothetical protein
MRRVRRNIIIIILIIIIIIIEIVRQSSSVGVATAYGLDDEDSLPDSLQTSSDTTHPPIRWVKLKVQSSLSLTKHYCTKTFGGSTCIDLVFLTLVPVEGELLNSRPGRFTPGEKHHCSHWIGECVGPSLSGRYR